jgi:hypothetical protein
MRCLSIIKGLEGLEEAKFFVEISQALIVRKGRVFVYERLQVFHGVNSTKLFV